ncbi:MAG: M48 family metallopeptidase, partial [Brevefilum fermentans]
MPLSTEISQIIRSKRKTYSLEVKPDGQLIVRAPESATRAEINAVVKAKAAWIEKTRARLAAKPAMPPPKTFTPGEKFWYLGKQYPLRLTDRRYPLLDLDGSFNLARHVGGRAREVFVAWYREETRQITHDLIASYVAGYGFNVNAVSITSARTRWGSCSGKGNLNFTYRL